MSTLRTCKVSFPRDGPFEAVIDCVQDASASADDAREDICRRIDSLSRVFVPIRNVLIRSGYPLGNSARNEIDLAAEQAGFAVEIRAEDRDEAIDDDRSTFIYDGINISIERGSENVPRDGHFHVLINGAMLGQRFREQSRAAEAARKAARLIAER